MRGGDRKQKRVDVETKIVLYVRKLNLRNCTICTHNKRENIDKELLEKVPLRNIAKQYNVSTGALFRHKENHLPDKLIKAENVKEITEANNLIEQAQTLKDRAIEILDTVEKQGSHTIALQAIKEVRAIIELLAKLSGDIQTGFTINLSPEWINLRTVIINAIAPYPEAQNAVLKALEQYNDN